MARTDEFDDGSIDDGLAALADEHRRLVVQFFADTPEDTASRAELAEYILARSSDDRTRDELDLRLHHAVLPMLADKNLLEYDPRSGSVRYRGNALVERIIALIEERRERPAED